MNRIAELLAHGQSCWMDDLTRQMVVDGELARWIGDGVRGITTNPAILEKATSEGDAYKSDIAKDQQRGLAPAEIYDELITTDVRKACDLMRPVYDTSNGEDGFVSLEVSPYLAHDTQGSIDEARRYWREVDRPNLFIKIPGTAEGVPAIEQMLFEGVNINITLLFSIESYEAVAEAYVRALERRVAEGLPIDRLASVASFFLSRIDVLVDEKLGDAKHLKGKAAVANAKLAYQSFKRLLAGDRWKRLAAKGARPQRMLWASTSTKNQDYDDLMYVEPLIGPMTINTMPRKTIEAFLDHGEVADTVEQDVENARRLMAEVEQAGISFARVTRQLEDEGIQKFIEPYDKLIARLGRGAA
jgi:transketolase